MFSYAEKIQEAYHVSSRSSKRYNFKTDILAATYTGL